MIDPPKTIEQAQAYRYNEKSSNPKGTAYSMYRCAYEVWQSSWDAHQCNRRAGYGPDQLYCKQHAREVK